ncbi:hypothetical protein NC651_034377 [Populus alba x Populus x berolinensis]|nr:hypothetical protein NC651_034377 [Populus alba x Populus x berolinensis]
MTFHLVLNKNPDPATTLRCPGKYEQGCGELINYISTMPSSVEIIRAVEEILGPVEKLQELESDCVGIMDENAF